MLDGSPPVNKITVVLLGVLSTAFLAWAGVVYQASQTAVKQTTQLNTKIVEIVSGIQANQASLLTEVRLTAKALERHEELKWHAGAGEQLPLLKDAVERLEKDVKELEKELRSKWETEEYGTR